MAGAGRVDYLAELLRVSERAIEAAASMAAARRAAIYRATAAPGAKEVQRESGAGDELLGRGDGAALERLRTYAPYLSAEEKREVDRRAVRAGGRPVFGEGA